jgi:hypothetical protein
MDHRLSRQRQVRSIISKDSRLIESTLVTDYAVPREEALRLEQELFTWFDRLSRRPGVPDTRKALRAHLISMTCKVGHVYWSGRPEVPADERVKRALALGPEIIAIELEKRIEETGDSAEEVWPAP